MRCGVLVVVRIRVDLVSAGRAGPGRTELVWAWFLLGVDSTVLLNALPNKLSLMAEIRFQIFAKSKEALLLEICVATSFSTRQDSRSSPCR